MASESIAHSAFTLMGYLLRARGIIVKYTYPFIYLKPKKGISLGRIPSVLKQVLLLSTGGSFSRKMLVDVCPPRK